MITRKRRRSSQSPATKNLPSKRTRRVANYAENSRNAIDDSLTSQNSVTTNSYPVRAILAENSDEFLIDWEDDLITGESYSPTWVRVHISLVSSSRIILRIR